MNFTHTPFWDFFTGLIQDFCQKLYKRFHACLFFGQIMFDEHPVRKQALPDYKNIDFT